MYTIYLSLGSNLGDRQAHLDRALQQLRRAGVEVNRLSSVYETEPVSLRAQPWFLNLVVEGKTGLFPVQLLHRLQSIEIAMGRRRSMAGTGPRTIDIDILFYGNFVIESPELIVPHPRLTERRFVLEPLMDLAPDLRHPVCHLTVRQLMATTPDRAVVKRCDSLLPGV